MKKKRYEFIVPFTPCKIAIHVSFLDEYIDVTILLRYKKVWRWAGGIEIYIKEQINESTN